MNFGIGNYSAPSGGAATLPGAGATNYDPAFGGVPQIPNPGSTQSSAISGNQGNLQALIQFLSGLNTSQQGQELNNIGMAIPNYPGLTQTASSVTGDALHGKVGDDVINQLVQQASERGITTGMPGGPNSNAAYLRALGLTSIDQQQTGIKDLASLTTTAPMAPLFNPASFLVSAGDQQQAQTAANTMASAPSPGAAANKAIGIASTGEPESNIPWWARSSGMPMALGQGSYLQGGVWHTPR